MAAWTTWWRRSAHLGRCWATAAAGTWASDHHFKTIGTNSSGYYPGEYAKTYVWIDNKNTGIKGVLEGVRSGKMFSVFGDLINALDFNIASGASKGEMGGELKAKAGETVTVTIR
jgi:hypothetical protein